MKFASDIALSNGLIGGIILGISSSGLLYFQDKITGVSGILENAVVRFESIDLAYVLGLLSSGYILSLTKPEVFGGPSAEFTSGTCSIIISGVLCGFGSRLGSGCTSGHGICGLPRLSLRSLVAVITFMSTGALSAYYTREYRIPVNSFNPFTSWNGPITDNFLPFVTPTIVSVGMSYLFKKLKSISSSTSKATTMAALINSFSSAMIFGVGLGISGMLNPARVIKFLDFTAVWDPSLMAVMGGGVLINLITFRYLKNYSQIKYFKDPSNLKIDSALIAGSALFGLSWGWTGMCPAPVLLSFGAGVSTTKLFLPSMIGGMLLNEMWIKDNSKNEIKSN